MYTLFVMSDMGKLVLCYWVIQILSKYILQISASGSFLANPSLNPDVNSISFQKVSLMSLLGQDAEEYKYDGGLALASSVFTDLSTPGFLSITIPNLKTSEFPTFTHGRI